MTKEQRKEIENFIKKDTNTMTFPQAQAIAQTILENHDMLKELTGSKQREVPEEPIRVYAPKGMGNPKEIAKRVKKSLWEIGKRRGW